MHTKRIFFIVLIVICFGIGAYLYLNRGETPADNSTMSSTASYANTEYGYSLDYPADLTYREYALGNTVFGHEADDVMEGKVETRVLVTQGAPGQSFEDTVGAELSLLCAADGPDSSFSCDGVEQVQPFTTRNGHEGLVLYLRGSLTNLATGESTAVGKGPYFVLPIQTGATGSQVLIIHPPLNKSAEEADSTLIRTVAESVRLSAD